MSYRIIENGNGGIKEFVVDTLDDLKILPKEAMGSTAFVIASCQLFILNSQGEWKELN